MVRRERHEGGWRGRDRLGRDEVEAFSLCEHPVMLERLSPLVCPGKSMPACAKEAV